MGYHALWSHPFQIGPTKHDPSLRQYLEIDYFQKSNRASKIGQNRRLEYLSQVLFKSDAK